MSSEVKELQKRLKVAEAEICELRKQAKENAAIMDVMAADETALEMQTILLNSQINDLEMLLVDSDEQLSENITVLYVLREAIGKLKVTSATTMEQAKATSSRGQKADTLIDLATKTKFQDEVEILEETQKKIETFRQKIKPR